MSAFLDQRSSASTMPDGELVCSYDLRGNIIEISDMFQHLTGYRAQDIQRMRLGDLLEQSSWDLASRDILDHIGGGNPQPYYVTARTKRGDAVVLHLTTRLVFEKGKPVAIQGFGRDVPPEVKALHEAEAKLSSKSSELQRFTAHLKQLHRLSTTNYQWPEALFSDYLRTGCEMFGLPLGMVLQLDGEYVAVRAFHGESEFFRVGARLRLAASHCGSLNQRLRTEMYDRGGEVSQLHRELRVVIATPILVDSELYGTLTFSSPAVPAKRYFTREEKEIIELMARSIGRFVLEDRIQSERRHAENLQRDRNLVLEMVAENQPLERTLTKLASLVETQARPLLCSIFTVRNGALVCAAAPSLPSGFMAMADALHLNPVPVQTGDVRLSTLPIFAETGERHPLAASRFPLPACLGLRHASSSPIVSGAGQLLGAVTLHSDQPIQPTTAIVDVFSMASRMGAIAIEQRELTDRLAFQAQHDALTGLPNRRRFIEILEHALATEASPIAVLFIDLDRLKQVNDTLGHSVGDILLHQVAARLKAALHSPDDVAARMGGDEFTVLLVNPGDAAAAIRSARQILQSLRAPYLVDGQELYVSASIGISFFPEDGADAASLLRNADMAMYWVKNGGKNDVVRYVPQPQSISPGNLELETGLRRALDKDEFEMSYQPIYSIAGELYGLEVLLGWQHPNLGRIPPKKFIPLAEETGLIVPIGSWVIRQACEQGARWLRAGKKLTRLSVNVSAVQFAREDFVDNVASALQASGFPPEKLDLELTESYVMRDWEGSARRMSHLRDLGVSMTVDDFGTGYSSLSYLQQLPIDALKIDQSFLRDLAASEQVIQTIIALAHTMHLSVVAEGVETEEALELLRSAGCDYVQGHLFGEALPRGKAEAMLSSTAEGKPSILGESSTVNTRFDLSRPNE